MTTISTYSDMRDALIAIVRDASALTLAHFNAGCASQKKADGSIVTIADTQAEALIKARLATLYPDVAFLGEESIAAGLTPDLSGPFFCVDPIDGTRQFAAGDPEWVVSVAYVAGGRPMIGVICAPVTGRLFAGIVGDGGFEQVLDGPRLAFPSATTPHKPLRVVHGGHDHPDKVGAMLPHGQTVELSCIGSALKFGLVACGQADIFARAGRVWDWDIAAGEAIIVASGGRVVDSLGQRLEYGQAQNGYRHSPFLAYHGGVDFDE